MKIVLTEKEFRAAGEMIGKVTLCKNEIEAILSMDYGTYTADEVLSAMEISEERIKEFNNIIPGVASVTKTEGNDLIFEINEDFVVDVCGLFSGFVGELAGGIKYMLKGLYVFYGMKVEPFSKKWAKFVETKRGLDKGASEE